MTYRIRISKKDQGKRIRIIRVFPSGKDGQDLSIYIPNVQWRLLVVSMGLDVEVVRESIVNGLNSKEISFDRKGVWDWITRRIASPELLKLLDRNIKELRSL